ncbi:sushi, von Willebrand factor type A, EGF and pentraxin domain-containing protein 1-like [Engraulis encrasicolus]|uniref:sushi, von Willebrand factor type A, EGF and pentraxin domain-containing protein 1-like n=1 Tax=Engraulis encrasicolus TaxID=184585 RepID=UPI002FCF2E06
MKTAVLLLCCVVLASSQTEEPDGVCLAASLPVVANAEVSEEYVRERYLHGSLLAFSCQLGYASAGRTVYSCSNSTWVPVRRGRCIPRPCELPEDTPNGSYDIVQGTDLVFGTIIKYSCNDGYRLMSRFDTRVCMVEGWSGNLPVCEAISCEPPPDLPGLMMTGLPEMEDAAIEYGHKLQLACGPGMALMGQREISCTATGQWSHRWPTCEEITCELGQTDPSVTVTGTATHGGRWRVGDTLHFSCAQDGKALQGEEWVTCTASGEWSTPFPVCKEVRCPRSDIPHGVRVHGLPGGDGPIRMGTTLHFSCSSNDLRLVGEPEATCQKNGRWSNTFPRCVVPDGFCSPPQVRFADVTGTSKDVYSHKEWVQLKCPPYYKLEGESNYYPSYMQCWSGTWTRTIRCWAPCTVTPQAMDQRNIEFKIKKPDLRYIPHKDQVTFVCKAGMRLTRGSPALAQRCHDGHMPFPQCS